MGRQYYINGETMVTVKGSSSSALISAVTQLGLSEDAIQVTLEASHDDIGVDAYGNTGRPNPPDQQIFGFHAIVAMNLVHYDPLVLQECYRLSMGGASNIGLATPPSEGQQARAGTLMGGNQALYGAQNSYISVGISSPVGGIPWLFYAAQMTGPPIIYPLGTRRSTVACRWKAIAYSVDPWNGGLGSSNVPVYAHLTLT